MVKPTATQDLVETVFILCSEVLPSVAFLYVMPKLDNSFDEPSLLSLVVRATSPFRYAGPHPENDRVVDGSRMTHSYNAL